MVRKKRKKIIRRIIRRRVIKKISKTRARSRIPKRIIKRFLKPKKKIIRGKPVVSQRLVAVGVGKTKMQDVKVTTSNGKIVKKEFRGKPIPESPRFKASGRRGKSVQQIVDEQIKKQSLQKRVMPIKSRPKVKAPKGLEF